MITLSKKMIGLLVVLTVSKTSIAQVSSLGNGFPGGAADYVGWNATRLFPVTIAHKGNFPINFQTNNIQRMRITPTGLVGIGLTGPVSMLHVLDNTTAGGNLFRTDGLTTNLNKWQLFTGTTEKFSLFVPENSSNTFLQTLQSTAIMGFKTSSSGTSFTRMFIRPGNGANGSGRMALGNNLTDDFIPQDRLHLYHNELSDVRIRFSHSGTDFNNTDGTNIGITNNGDFRLTQFENNFIDFFTPNTALTAVIRRFRIAPNGQVFIGSDNDAENVISNNLGQIGSGTFNFSQVPTALLNVRGAINSCAPIDILNNPVRTILYSYANPIGGTLDPLEGFRIKYNINFSGTNGDATVFEKVDNNALDPDGRMVFTNTGNDGVEENAFYIHGSGRSYSGKNLIGLQNRFTIDSEWDATLNPDASKSGLRFVDLIASINPLDLDLNPGSGVLSVDADGDVIYVAGGGVGATGATGADGPMGPIGLTGPAGPAGTSGVVAAVNGAWINGDDMVEFGTNPMEHNTVLPLNGFDLNVTQQGTLHISQGTTNLNTNAALDINTENSTNNIGLNFKGKNGNSLLNEKGIFAEMSLNTAAPDNNTVLLELSNTNKQTVSAGWLIKANGFHGNATQQSNLVDQASFGVLGNGNTVINANLSTYGVERANLFVSDIENSPTANGNPFTNEVGKRTMLISNTHPQGSVNYGLDVYSENTITSTYGIKTTARALNIASNAIGIMAESFTDNQTNAVGKNVGVSVKSHSLGALPINYGVDIVANGSATKNVGVYSLVGGIASSQNVGVDGIAQGTSINLIGVRGQGSGDGQVNYGVWGVASGASQANYGIYGAQSSGGTGTQYAAYFDGLTYNNGDVQVYGNITATGTITPSDQQFKTNIQPLRNAMTLINQLQPKNYNYDTVSFSDFGFENDLQMGLIAQDVELVIPTIVTNQVRQAQYDSIGIQTSPSITYKGVEYEELIPLLIAGAKEQQIQINQKDSLINDLNARLTQLENCLSALLPTLCNMNQQAIQQNNSQSQEEIQKEFQEKVKSSLQITLSNKNSIVLSQNVPNPFAESTVIEYSIPATVGKAQIHFYNSEGRIINSVDILERGNGELIVFANDLSSGVYTYTLVADGKVVSTKKMMKN